MKQSKEDLEILVDSKFYENSDQDITGADANEVFIDFLDSFAKVNDSLQVFSFKIRLEDLDEYDSVIFEHELNSMNLKIVMYDNLSKRIYREYFDFEPVDNSNAKITILKGISFNTFWSGYFYKVA
ncbi:hypothetical protein ES705_27047 [subsurface metagenome]